MVNLEVFFLVTTTVSRSLKSPNVETFLTSRCGSKHSGKSARTRNYKVSWTKDAVHSFRANSLSALCILAFDNKAKRWNKILIKQNMSSLKTFVKATMLFIYSSCPVVHTFKENRLLMIYFPDTENY